MNQKEVDEGGVDNFLFFFKICQFQIFMPVSENQIDFLFLKTFSVGDN